MNLTTDQIIECTLILHERYPATMIKEIMYNIMTNHTRRTWIELLSHGYLEPAMYRVYTHLMEVTA